MVLRKHHEKRVADASIKSVYILIRYARLNHYNVASCVFVCTRCAAAWGESEEEIGR